ncbi:hypothetical protein [Nocardia sp. NPDC057272]|uniref:hypothetical protein n=1 Tax=Nocardia sp. NPDC057272 TaxID=3346079 RepID=UPI00362DD796
MTFLFVGDGPSAAAALYRPTSTVIEVKPEKISVVREYFSAYAAYCVHTQISSLEGQAS